MKHLTLIFFVAIFSLSNPAYASLLRISELIPQLTPSSKQKQNDKGLIGKAPTSSKSAALDTCTNFSGTWKGTCTYEGQDPQPLEGTIVQTGCTELSEGVFTFYLGEISTETHAVQTEARALDWNDTKTVIRIAAAGITANPSLPHPGFTAPHFIQTLDGELKIENAKLVYQFTFLETAHPNTQSFKASCILDKQ